MKCIARFNNFHLKRNINPYRIITAVGFIVSVALILLTPLQMPDPDDWAYYNGTLNFSHGHFTIDNYTLMKQAGEIGRQGGWLIQYLPVKFNKWALEKAPGVVFYLIPFYLAGLPRWSTILLALGMVIVTYMLLKRLSDEKAAMTGSLLILFTPIGLVMLNRVYMDTYASLAFLVMGGGLYIYYHLERGSLTPVRGGVLLFLAFFFTGWSVIVRYTNLPVAVILALHLVIIRITAWRKKQCTGVKKEIIPLALGIGLPVLAISLYDYYVFGSPLKYGYSYSPYPISFAFQYIGQVDAEGVSIPLQIIRYNTQGYLRNLLIGFPLMIIGIPGLLAVLYYKFFKMNRPEGNWSGLRSELPWSVLLVLIGWLVSVFFLYLGYEWTAGLQKGGGFVIFNRFLLPGLFPVVVICALVIARFPYKVLIPVMAVFLVYGSLLYAQWALNLYILPAWLTERTLDTRWPGYVFPPWTEAGIQFYKP
jgi:hypothetical protein